MDDLLLTFPSCGSFIILAILPNFADISTVHALITDPTLTHVLCFYIYWIIKLSYGIWCIFLCCNLEQSLRRLRLILTSPTSLFWMCILQHLHNFSWYKFCLGILIKT
jgi:hypothetical protein